MPAGVVRGGGVAVFAEVLVTSVPRSTRCGLVLAAAVLAAMGQARPAAAASYNTDISAAGVRLGRQVAGPPLSVAAVRNHVTALAFWAVDCPICKKTLPALEAAFKQYGPTGVVVVGAVRGQPADADLARAIGECGLTFPIVAAADVAGGMDFKGTPHCIVFDHTGRCVYRGAPAGAAEAIASAFTLAPAAVCAGQSFERIAAVVQLAETEAGFATALRRAKALGESRDATVAEQAGRFVERLEAHGRTMLSRADDARTTDPTETAALLQRCAAAFKGTDVGAEAVAAINELKADAAFQAGLQAAQQFSRLQALRNELLKSAGGAAIATPDVVSRVPPAVKQQMAAIVSQVRQRLPGSRFATDADEIALEFGLEVMSP